MFSINARKLWNTPATCILTLILSCFLLATAHAAECPDGNAQRRGEQQGGAGASHTTGGDGQASPCPAESGPDKDLAKAQSTQCKSGKYCPAGSFCLEDGGCGRSTAEKCAPGWDFDPASGDCTPPGKIRCDGGGYCEPGQVCTPDGGCAPPLSGSVACQAPTGDGSCPRGTKCVGGNRCVDTRIMKVCRSGAVVPKNTYCMESPQGTSAWLTIRLGKQTVSPVVTQQPDKSRAEEQAALKAEREAQQKAEREAKEQAKREAQEKAKRDAEEQAARKAAEKAERDTQQKAEREAKDQAKREAQEKAKRDAEEQAARKAVEKAERDAQQKAERETKEQAKREAQEKAKRDAEERAARKAAEKAERDAKARQDGKQNSVKLPEASMAGKAEDASPRETNEQAQHESQSKSERAGEEHATLKTETEQKSSQDQESENGLPAAPRGLSANLPSQGVEAGKGPCGGSVMLVFESIENGEKVQCMYIPNKCMHFTTFRVKASNSEMITRRVGPGDTERICAPNNKAKLSLSGWSKANW
jgi:DNA segregation ATPase FtsK/SpoIIIE-like protein